MFGSKNTDSSETTAPGIWGSWERAWDPRWALRCWSFLLFLDIMSLIYRKAGILAYYEQSAFEAQDLVWLFFVIAVFSMMVTFILPLCFTLVRDVLFQVFPARWFGQSGWKKPDSSVGSSKVLSEALESGDVFLYDYYKERRQKWKKENERTQDAVILILLWVWNKVGNKMSSQAQLYSNSSTIKINNVGNFRRPQSKIPRKSW